MQTLFVFLFCHFFLVQPDALCLKGKRLLVEYWYDVLYGLKFRVILNVLDSNFLHGPWPSLV